MIRQPISRGWYGGLGAVSLVALGVGYTILSNQVHRAQPDNKTIPTWEQLYTDGFRPAFVEREETLPQAVLRTPAEKRQGRVVFAATLVGLAAVPGSPSFSLAAAAAAPKPPSLVYRDTTVKLRPWIWLDGRKTLSRLFGGLALATLVAVVLGVLMGCYQAVEAFFLPPLSFLAKIAPTAMIAVFLVLRDQGVPFYTGIILFGLVPILTQTVFHAARDDVPEELLFKARTLGATQLECIWDVIFKYILPKVLEAVRLQIGPAIVYLIAAEWVFGDVGFGCRMRLLQKSLDMSLIYTYLFTLGVFGLLVDRAMIWAQQRICPWYGR